MPRLAYLSTDVKDFYVRLDHLMDIAARSLDVKRKTISKLLDAGLYPYTKHYLGSFRNHFSTIGLVGMMNLTDSLTGSRLSLGMPVVNPYFSGLFLMSIAM